MLYKSRLIELNCKINFYYLSTLMCAYVVCAERCTHLLLLSLFLVVLIWSPSHYWINWCERKNKRTCLVRLCDITSCRHPASSQRLSHSGCGLQEGSVPGYQGGSGGDEVHQLFHTVHTCLPAHVSAGEPSAASLLGDSTPCKIQEMILSV